MAQLTSQLIVSLIDRVSGPAKSVSQSLRGIGAAVNSANSTALLRTSLDQKTNRSLDAMRARMSPRAQTSMRPLPISSAIASPRRVSMRLSKRVHCSA